MEEPPLAQQEDLAEEVGVFCLPCPSSQNRHYFADIIFKIKISLKFVSNGVINNKSILV